MEIHKTLRKTLIKPGGVYTEECWIKAKQTLATNRQPPGQHLLGEAWRINSAHLQNALISLL